MPLPKPFTGAKDLTKNLSQLALLRHHYLLDRNRIGLDAAQVNPVKALFWTAVINGLLAPFLLVGILLVACDPKIMHDQCSSLLGRAVVGPTALVMFGAAIGMFVF